jgi:hypothetical protein
LREIRTRPRRSVALLPIAAAVLLAGCGGAGPRLARQDAAPLITLADRIAREGPCAQARDIQALDNARIALVNGHRVPQALQESLSSGVNALVALTPPCLPTVPAAPVAPTTTTVPKHEKPPKHDHHGKGEGND